MLCLETSADEGSVSKRDKPDFTEAQPCSVRKQQEGYLIAQLNVSAL